MLKLSKQKNELLKTDGHILVLGGPGSGKTFIALLKAKEVVESERIKTGQKVLFLSFARATVARIEEQASGLKISNSVRQHLEINTYHGFAWSILKSHGYLLNSSSPLRLLPPPEAASHLADVVGDTARETEKRRLFEEDGLIHFDLFSSLSAHLLSKSKSLLTIFCNAYPVIILDEFQDTNPDEWNLVRLFGEKSRLIALADAEQRIYEFRGADPARIGEFINAFNPTQFDFGNENNRSNGTDIVQFGNDLLTGNNKKIKYNNVQCKGYPFKKGKQIHLNLKFTALEACKRLRDTGKDNWSLAILVPTKKLMLEVSDFMDAVQDLPNGRKLHALKHEVALETAGPSLAAILIAGLLEGGETDSEIINQFIKNLSDHMRGRKGNDPPSKKYLSLSDALIKYIETGKIQGKNRQFVVSEIIRIATECKKIHFLGDPANDWITVRKLVFGSKCEEIKQVAIDAQYLRLLHKGALLRSYLGEIWRNNGNYYGASDAVRNALLQEHFSTSTKTWIGINVMTIHKAKGKEFDEVIIYEGYYHGKIVRNDADKYKIEQSRYALRVAVTRAMIRTTILTPSDDICRFL